MRKLIAGLMAATALAAATPTFAQKVPETVPAAKAGFPVGVFYKGQQPTQTLVRDTLIGVKVTNKDNQVVGEIEDLILDADSKVLGVVMGVGGFLGVGEKKIGVRLGALKFSDVDGKRTASLPSASKEVLAQVGQYERLQQKKTMLQKASDSVKQGVAKAGEAAASVTQKAKDAMAPTPATTPVPATPAPATKP